jgi:uncharacterized protein (DUF983 family)
LTKSPAGVDPLLAGVLGRCPNCGRGPLFRGFLSLVPACAHCRYDLGHADSGDGPAVFVIIIVGFSAVFGALFMEVAANPPIWVLFAIWLPVAVGLCLGLLRPLKGLMVADQIRNKASEHRRDGAA